MPHTTIQADMIRFSQSLACGLHSNLLGPERKMQHAKAWTPNPVRQIKVNPQLQRFIPDTYLDLRSINPLDPRKQACEH